jgi:uncharacterized membrane protein YdfJ with MMPL/SSD domain
VIDGLATSGRIITSAALIMVSVFTSFILNGDPTVKQFGVGLAVAIAIDATLVRWGSRAASPLGESRAPKMGLKRARC